MGDGNQNQNNIEDLLDTKLGTNFDTEEEDLLKLEADLLRVVLLVQAFTSTC